MDQFDVSVVHCKDYQAENVRNALLQALQPLGGLGWVKPGMKIGLKANLVAAQKVETAATTHPEVLAQLTKLLCECGAHVVVGDSPGGLYTDVVLRHVYNVTGMDAVVQAGGELNHNFEEKTAAYPDAKVAKTFSYTAWLDDVDVIIDVCKLKSHGMMGMSAAAKNMFGVIPGTKKPEYHFRFPNMEDFSEMIIDLDEYFSPVLCIADAVVGMEGNGPTQGTPREMGAILASVSPHAMDLVCAHMLGMRPEEIPTLTAAQKRGLIPVSIADLRISGDIDAFLVENFEKIDTRNDLTFKSVAGGGVLGQLFGSVAQRVLASRPKVQKNECVGCGVCAGICPAKAIAIKEKLPDIDREKCIRCFCCQEFCPKGAMKVRRTWIAKLLSK